MFKGTLLPAIIEKISTLKDGSVSLTIYTQELSPQKAAELFGLRGKLATVYLSPSEISSYEDSEHVEDIVPETLLGRITAYIFLKVLQCIVFFCDAYRGYKRLHPIVKGMIWSALAGIGIGLLLVLTIFLILEY